MKKLLLLLFLIPNLVVARHHWGDPSVYGEVGGSSGGDGFIGLIVVLIMGAGVFFVLFLILAISDKKTREDILNSGKNKFKKHIAEPIKKEINEINDDIDKAKQEKQKKTEQERKDAERDREIIEEEERKREQLQQRKEEEMEEEIFEEKYKPQPLTEEELNEKAKRELAELEEKYKPQPADKK